MVTPWWNWPSFETQASQQCLENCWIDCQEDAAWQLTVLVTVPELKTYSVAPLIADKKQTSVTSCERTPEILEQRFQGLTIEGKLYPVLL